MKRLILVSLVLALPAIGTPAGASSRGTAPKYDVGSCIDKNRDGRCGESDDMPLGQALGTIDTYVDHPDADPSKPSAAGAYDLVLNGTNVLPDGTDIIVHGNVHIAGTLQLTTTSVGATISTVLGSIDVANGASIAGGMDFMTRNGGDVTIGNNTRLTSANDSNGSLSFYASGRISLGSGSVMHASGSYTEVAFFGTKGTTIAPEQTFTAPNHGGFHVQTAGNLTIDHFSGKGGYFDIETTGGNITLSNSTITQTYKNGDLRIIANSLASKLWFDHVTITYKQVDHSPLYIPDPTIIG